MKQVLQPVSRGGVLVADIPPPQIRPAGILVRTAASLISAGTERASLEFAERSLIGKARSRPDLVRQVIEKVKRDGFLEAAAAVRARLDEPIPLGYSCAGVVIAVGDQAGEFQPGDVVACAGAGYAGHAEVNYIPRNLAVAIPHRRDGLPVAAGEACFATVGAVALHAVRLTRTGIGDRVAVIGCGLIGLLAGQILKAQGAFVMGVEPEPGRRARARHAGFDEVLAPEDARAGVEALTRGIGADAVIIAASSRDSAPVVLAGDIARDRASVVVVGTTGLDVPRPTYFRKELSLVVSRSYGPGRYDRAFEEHGQDYPAGYVRWTERENMRAFLELVATERVQVRELITDRVPLADAERAYRMLDDPAALAIVLEYPVVADAADPALRPVRIDLHTQTSAIEGAIGVSLIGAGTFARTTLLPILRGMENVELGGVVSGRGASARAAADRFGFRFCGSSADTLWSDERTGIVVVAARNHLHAGYVNAAISAGKHVFVEKPLALTPVQLDSIIRTRVEASARHRLPLIGIGFNRRFAPAAVAVRSLFEAVASPLTLVYRVNAGRLADGNWVADPIEGGGRILSEACHFVDLSTFLLGARPSIVTACGIGGANPNVAITIEYENGSIATITICSDGDRSYSKERIEVLGAGRVGVIDDFRRHWLVSGGRTRRYGGVLHRPRKGHREALMAFVDAVRLGGAAPISFEQAVETTRITFAIEESLRRRSTVPLDEELAG